MITSIRGWQGRLYEHYINPLDRRRAISLLVMNGLLLLASIIGFGALVVLPLTQGLPVSVADVIPFAFAPVVLVVSVRFILIGELRIAARVFVGIVLAGILIPRLGQVNGTETMVLIIPIVAAGMLLERRELLIVAGVTLLALVFAALNQAQMVEPTAAILARTLPVDLSFALLGVGITLALLYLFAGAADRLSNDMVQTQRHLTNIQSFRTAVGQIADDTALLLRLNSLLTQEMQYTFAQVYLYDEQGQQLNVYVRTGTGTRFVVRTAELGPESAVQVALRRHEMQMVTPATPYLQRAYLMPSIQYALVLPLLVEGQVIGVLDIQSSALENPFQDSEVRLLQLVATDLAQSLVQMRVQSELRTALAESQRVSTRLESQVNDLRRRLEQSFGGDWAHYLEGRGSTALGFDILNREVQPASDLPPDLQAAMQRRETVVETHDREQVVNIPIVQHNEVLGAMSFALPRDQVITSRQLEMARAVAARLTAALENARLVEQSQAQASRERKTSEIAGQLMSQQEVRTLLDTAAGSFNEALGAIYTRIYLEPGALVTQSEEAL
jgi:GAF domain-containing protein